MGQRGQKNLQYVAVLRIGKSFTESSMVTMQHVHFESEKMRDEEYKNAGEESR